jgi:hypothetical protein
MKILTLMVLASFALNVLAAPPTGPAANRAASRIRLNAVPANVSTATGQAYFDCNGIGIPNESTAIQAYSMACPQLASLANAVPIAVTAPATETAAEPTRTYSTTTSLADVGVAAYTAPATATAAPATETATATSATTSAFRGF